LCSPYASPPAVEFPSGECECPGVGGIGGGEDAFDSRIDADYAALRFGFGNGYPVAEDEVPAVPLFLKDGVLPRLDWWHSFVRYFDWFSPEAEPLGLGEGKITIPDHRHNQPPEIDRMPPSLAPLGKEGRSDVAEGGAGELGWEAKSFPDDRIVPLVEIDGIGLPGGKDDIRQPVAGEEESATDIIKVLRLTDLELDGSGLFHHTILYNKISENPCRETLKERRRFLPRLKPWVSSPMTS